MKTKSLATKFIEQKIVSKKDLENMTSLGELIACGFAILFSAVVWGFTISPLLGISVSSLLPLQYFFVKFLKKRWTFIYEKYQKKQNAFNKKLDEMNKNDKVLIRKIDENSFEILFKFKHYFICFKGNEKEQNFYKINNDGQIGKSNELLSYYLKNYIFEILIPQDIKNEKAIPDFVNEVSKVLQDSNHEESYKNKKDKEKYV